MLQAIETGLFSIYPVVFVVQITWIISVMTSMMVAPYVFAVLGYVEHFYPLIYCSIYNFYRKTSAGVLECVVGNGLPLRDSPL